MVTALQLAGCTRRAAPPPPPGGTYLSTSAGASFEQSVMVEGGEEGEHIAGFSLQAAHRLVHEPQTVYVAAAEAGLVVSKNGGNTWQRVVVPLARTLDVVVLPSGVVVVSGTGNDGQGFVLRSLDEGKSWQTVLTIPVPVEEKKTFQIIGRSKVIASVILSLELDPTTPDRIYAGSNLGTIFIGEQAAKEWRSGFTVSLNRIFSAADQTVSIQRIVPSPHRSGELMLITSEGKLVRMTEGTQAEISVPEFIGQEAPLGRSRKSRKVRSVSFVPGLPDALFVGVEDGVVVSRDAGSTWEELGVPVETTEEFNSVVVAVSPTNTSRLLVAINGVIYRSEDGGRKWNTFSLQLKTHIITDVLIDPTNASRVLLVTTPLRT